METSLKQFQSEEGCWDFLADEKMIQKPARHSGQDTSYHQGPILTGLSAFRSFFLL